MEDDDDENDDEKQLQFVFFQKRKIYIYIGILTMAESTDFHCAAIRYDRGGEVSMASPWVPGRGQCRVSATDSAPEIWKEC